VLLTVSARAQDNSSSLSKFIHNWEARATANQAKQPRWIAPLVTTTSELFQLYRYDQSRQIAPALTHTLNYGYDKGLCLLPWGNLELIVTPPPYIEHNSKAKDGAGDMAVMGQYRFVTGNEQHGNYSLAGWIYSTVPTGSYSNGVHDATLQPTLGGGKGFDKFDVQATLGAILPLGNTTYKTTGRPILWNTVAQYRTSKYLVPELESNATYYKDGTNDGKVQEFLTPGLMCGKFRFHPHDLNSRSAVVGGAGMQIATSRFHTYNHAVVLDLRFLF